MHAFILYLYHHGARYNYNKIVYISQNVQATPMRVAETDNDIVKRESSIRICKQHLIQGGNYGFKNYIIYSGTCRTQILGMWATFLRYMRIHDTIINSIQNSYSFAIKCRFCVWWTMHAFILYLYHHGARYNYNKIVYISQNVQATPMRVAENVETKLTFHLIVLLPHQNTLKM
jgi:hypothetical protein